MIYQIHHLKLPILSFPGVCCLSSIASCEGGWQKNETNPKLSAAKSARGGKAKLETATMKKQNEPKLVSRLRSVLRNEAKFEFSCSLGLRFLGPWVPGFLRSWLFVQTNPILNFTNEPYMLINKGHITYDIVFRTSKNKANFGHFWTKSVSFATQLVSNLRKTKPICHPGLSLSLSGAKEARTQGDFARPSKNETNPNRPMILTANNQYTDSIYPVLSFIYSNINYLYIDV